MSIYPAHRTEGVIVKKLKDETMIYDLDNHSATCLNAVAGSVWDLCDGAHDVDAILEQSLAQDMASVEVALGQIGQAGLLQQEFISAGPTRREVFGQLIGGARVAAIAAPSVLSMAVPAAAQAMSCIGDGVFGCASVADCCDPDSICLGGVCTSFPGGGA
ncbi:hypothetical protein GCM10007939_10340 [Amylibacter marinus]|uniref:Coenzyme PQQ synthesis protein D (PqqD) n=1 Tax=Amylibacter marinus TaxID=1475483 RepID=A0ABQ5VU06_9RHOB|nr:PqqD family peptide modification chaperone [Amylibacter marinus]GLQ34751.1 hypothetical protein GCM10007939_10340 [Amylibacter marinus]